MYNITAPTNDIYRSQHELQTKDRLSRIML